MQQLYRKLHLVEPIHAVESTENETNKGRRAEIKSPKEKERVMRMFLFYGRSITKLANLLDAEERAIENVIRQRMYHVYPPMQRAA